MGWLCSDCNTRHQTDQEIDACREMQRKQRLFSISLMTGVAVLLLALAIAWNTYAYGDWRCTFIECRKVFK